VLSTRTLEFFAERGFLESSPNLLPPERPYNSARGSKVWTGLLFQLQNEAWKKKANFSWLQRYFCGYISVVIGTGCSVFGCCVCVFVWF
jgi:hypothetical protein